jgi:hypothetical protein
MANKLFLTALLVFFPVKWQLPLGMCWLILFIGLILYRDPYVRRSDDRLQLMAQVEIFLLLMAGRVLQWDGSFQPGSAIDIAISVLLITTTVALLLVFIGFGFAHLRMVYWRHYRELAKAAALEREMAATSPSPLVAAATSPSYALPPEQEMTPVHSN